MLGGLCRGVYSNPFTAFSGVVGIARYLILSTRFAHAGAAGAMIEDQTWPKRLSSLL